MQAASGVADEVAALRLLGARVLVDPEPVNERTTGGLIKPDTARLMYSQRGRVVVVGDKAVHVQVGDTVLHGRWAHVAVELNGRDYLVFNESDLMGVLRNGGSR